MLRTFPFIFSIIIFLHQNGVEAQQLRNLSTRIDSVIISQKKMDFGGAVLVASEGEVVFYRNYKLKAEDSFSFWIGSLSKQFCAAAILKLQEMGKISVQETIDNYLANVPADKAHITIHQLLTHTSGLGDNYAADGIEYSSKARETILSHSTGEPGAYSYSSDGYHLLAIIIEEITGISYEQFLHEQFFIPLEMKETGCAGDQKKWQSLLFAFPPKKKNGNPQEWSTNYGYKGATGVLSSAKDLLKWKNALLERKVLNAASLEQLLTRHVPKRSIHYGYGWNLFDGSKGRVMVHSGDDDFILHSATLRHYLDKDLTVIVLSHHGYYRKSPMANLLAAEILSVLFP